MPSNRGFLLTGDFFGFTANTEFDFTVEAVTDPTRVAAYPRRQVERLAYSDPELARHIRRLTFEAMACFQTQVRILGRVTALDQMIEPIGSYFDYVVPGVID